MKIIADQHIPYLNEYFSSCILVDGRKLSAQEVKDADVLLVRSVTKVNEQLLAGSSVKFVGSVATGEDHLDQSYLQAAGIAYATAKGFNAAPVADYVVSVVAAMQLRGSLLTENKTAAIIGVGQIGSLVSERLAQLNFSVIECDPIRAIHEPGFKSTPLHEIAEVDLISLHVPLTASAPFPTHHFLSPAFLKKQKPGCVLLNASRGAVIASQALLQAGQHLHWCLDVWENEPDINLDVLKQAVIATPHLAGYSLQSKRRGIAMIYAAMLKNKIFKEALQPIASPPPQTLTLSRHYSTWQAVVLEVFNPLILTERMKHHLLSDNNLARAFDAMRNGLPLKHEFAFTKLLGEIPLAEKKILEKLGMQVRK